MIGAIVAMHGYDAGDETHGDPAVAQTWPLRPDRSETALARVALIDRALVTNDPSMFKSDLPLENYRSRIWTMAERQLEEALEYLRHHQP